MSEYDIIPIRGEPFRYLVRSTTRKDEEHTVDLCYNDGNGECSCEDFTFRRLKNWRTGHEIVNWERDKDGKVRQDATRCKHLHVSYLKLATMTAREANIMDRPAPVTVKASEDGLPF